jgi:hypothetical protein
LFHGVRGSLVLPTDEWIAAEIKTVYDGSKDTATPYKSGFHVMESYDDLVKFSNRFRKIDDLCMAEVDVAGWIWEKEHSPSNILLAEKMRIPKRQWDARIMIRSIR